MNDSTQSGQEQKKEKKAVGVFPRLSFSKTMELVEAIYQLGEGEPVRRRTVFDKLGKSSESGPSRTLIIAANSGYGLTTGSYKAEYLGITDRGMQTVSYKNSVSKFEAVYDALFSNEIFSAMVSRFNDRGIPIDEIAIEYLKSNHELPREDAQACWAVFKDNLTEQNLTQELSGKRVIVSRDAALETLGKSTVKKGVQPGDETPPHDNTTEASESPDSKVGARKFTGRTDTITPQIHFNIQVVIPENASPETYEYIFKSIATHLLGRSEA